MWARRILSLVAVLALHGLSAHAASTGDAIEELQKDVDRISARLTEVSQNYENRRGLIGTVEARIRYEDAVYDFLIGNFAEAANSFFVLVESEALATPALHRDSEWYLAEALFELGNYETAATAYGGIVEVGPTHPFFADAVRRQIEIYGILKDSERFDDLYQKYIVTGKVPATDLVKYTVAKSFYRQGEHGQAADLLAEIQPDSLFYARSKYLVGVVQTSQGRFKEALPEFVAASQLQPKNSLDKEVIDLANLAAARLYYETGDFSKSADHYSKLSNESEYFADELYELVWTFIKQEEWADAVRAVDTFLIAFPDHRYAMQLQLLRGHLNVKQETYPDALGAYESVVTAYSPVRDSISRIDLETTDPLAFFNEVAESDTIKVGGEELPKYATEMLFANDYMARARVIHKELSTQSEDLSDSRMMVEEIQGVLGSGSDSIGTFAWGRREINGLRDEVLRLLGQTMHLEVAYLEDNLPDKMHGELDAISGEIDVLATKMAQTKSADTAATDRSSVYEAQVRAVQNRAFKVEAIARDLQSQADSVRTFLGTSKLKDAERASVTQQLATAEADLDQAVQKLERVMGDTTRRQLMSHVGSVAPSAEASADRSKLLSSYGSLQQKISAYKSDVASADASSVFGTADRLWSMLIAFDDQARAADARLDETQQRELAVLKEQLLREAANVSQSSITLDQTNEAAALLVSKVARHGLAELQSEFNDAILRADMGIVDVFWLQKTSVSDEITSLFKERTTQLKELDQRYGVVNQLESE